MVIKKDMPGLFSFLLEKSAKSISMYLKVIKKKLKNYKKIQIFIYITFL